MCFICLLKIIFGTAGFLAVSFICIEWIVHRRMTMCDSKCYGYGSFKMFLKYYESFDFKKDPKWKYSHFCYDDQVFAKGYIHAGIVRFDKHGMVLRFPVDFLKYKFWLWKNRTEGPKKVKFKSLKKDFKDD